MKWKHDYLIYALKKFYVFMKGSWIAVEALKYSFSNVKKI